MDSDKTPDYGPHNRGLVGQRGKWTGVTCSAEGCELPAKCRGLCQSHYGKQKWASGYRSPSVNPESQRARHLKHRYGLTPAAHAELLAAQGGKCAVCGDLENDRTPGHWRGRLCVDHDHDTGKVRGLLCNDCNAAAGHAGTERVALALAEYLRLHA